MLVTSQVIANDVAPEGYRIAHVSHESRKEGGVVVIYKSVLKGCNLTNKTFGSFECIDILLKCTSDTIRICIIYRSRSGSKSGSSIAEFLSKF